MSSEPAVLGPPGERPLRGGWRSRLAREVLIITLALLAYRLARLITSGEVDEAMANADRVLHLERLLRLPDELAVQGLVVSRDWLVESANVYYAAVHFPATTLFLVWAYARRPRHYAWVRNTLIGLTAVALAVHLFTPLAPPRMLGSLGFVDTGAVYGPAVYGPPETDHISNQYAAMPSLHVGWAVFVAVGVVVMTRSKLRWLALLHPLVTSVVVVGTANHYWLDGAVAVVLLALVLLVQGRPPPAPPVAGPAAACQVAEEVAAARSPSPRQPRRALVPCPRRAADDGPVGTDGADQAEGCRHR